MGALGTTRVCPAATWQLVRTVKHARKVRGGSP